MRLKYINQLIASAVLLFISVSPGIAGEPTDRIRQSTDKLLAIATNAELNAPEKKEERDRAIRSAVDEVFNWEAFSQRALGRHWKKLTAEDKEEFINIFGELLEHTYMDKTRQYSGEKVEYLEEEIDGKFGVVKALVITKDKKEVAVDYSIENREGEWFVYDLNVEGVSLVNNYRVQFNSIIMRSSYDELKKRLYAKVEDNQDE
jgi:phospholipid transport system substrate-binding protein